MRKRRKTVKLQRTASHRKSLLNTLAKQLVEHRRIRTTLAKAKALRPFAEKLLTYGKKALAAAGKEAADRVHYSRLAFAKLRDKDLVHKLVHEIAAASKDRNGGYTRITKLGQRRTDAAPMAFIEWVDAFVGPSNGNEAEEQEEVKEEKPARGKKTSKTEDDAEGEAPAKLKRAAKKKAATAE